ncbi:hypothetical protein H4Q26_012498 [Puccinia striiformis f. sp. tritici PST-130]|nr:hypothetical protein H4Q26_012498 [Puccinia striiformis f. sp. tritici PST-130]
MGFRTSRLHPGWSRCHQSIEFSIDVPPYNDVSTYGTIIRDHNLQCLLQVYNVRHGCFDGLHRADIVGVVHDMKLKTRVQVTKPQPPEVLVAAYDPTLKGSNNQQNIRGV